jgi:hypothetical protein
MDDILPDWEVDMGTRIPENDDIPSFDPSTTGGQELRHGDEVSKIDHLSDSESQPDSNFPPAPQEALETQLASDSIPQDPTLELRTVLSGVDGEVPPDLINRIVKVVFDGLQRSVDWTLSVKSFEQLLELLRSTWVEANGNSYEGQFFPKTMEDTLSILRLAGYQDATVYYTCLRKDHYYNMTSSSSTCPVCGSEARSGIKWLYVGGFHS